MLLQKLLKHFAKKKEEEEEEKKPPPANHKSKHRLNSFWWKSIMKIHSAEADLSTVPPILRNSATQFCLGIKATLQPCCGMHHYAISFKMSAGKLLSQMIHSWKKKCTLSTSSVFLLLLTTGEIHVCLQVCCCKFNNWVKYESLIGDWNQVKNRSKDHMNSHQFYTEAKPPEYRNDGAGRSPSSLTRPPPGPCVRMRIKHWQ